MDSKRDDHENKHKSPKSITTNTQLYNKLENSSQILELLEYIDLSEGLTQQAQFGLFLILERVIDSVNSVGEQLKNLEEQPKNRFRKHDRKAD